MTSTLYLHLIQKMKLSLSSLVAHSELKAAPLPSWWSRSFFWRCPQPLSHCCQFFIQAHCPQFNQLFLTASTYSLCRQNASGSSIWKKSLNWLSYSELPAIERQLYDLKAWKQESLQQQKKDHDSQIIHFKRQLAIFMKILRYNPSGEIYGAENNLEALRLQHLQYSIISHWQQIDKRCRKNWQNQSKPGNFGNCKFPSRAQGCQCPGHIID